MSAKHATVITTSILPGRGVRQVYTPLIYLANVRPFLNAAAANDRDIVTFLGIQVCSLKTTIRMYARVFFGSTSAEPGEVKEA